MAADGSGIVWTPELEVTLFHAMKGHKPTGINRFFQLGCIFDRFFSDNKKNISAKSILQRLETMYNLEALNELESAPFPNEEIEFSLPEEIMNPAISGPPSPATSTDDNIGTQRPTNLKLLNLQASALATTPESSVPSPKRKRTRVGLTSSQPSSPAPGTPGSKRRR